MRSAYASLVLMLLSCPGCGKAAEIERQKPVTPVSSERPRDPPRLVTPASLVPPRDPREPQGRFVTPILGALSFVSESLELKEGRYQRIFHTCTGSQSSSGTYKFYDDTITLTEETISFDYLDDVRIKAWLKERPPTSDLRGTWYVDRVNGVPVLWREEIRNAWREVDRDPALLRKWGFDDFYPKILIQPPPNIDGSKKIVSILMLLTEEQRQQSGIRGF